MIMSKELMHVYLNSFFSLKLAVGGAIEVRR